MKKNLNILAIGGVLACSPGQTNPPTAQLSGLSLWMQSSIPESSQSGQNQAGLYLAAKQLSAQGPNSLACRNYRQLAADTSFPLHGLAELRALESCGQDRATIEAWWQARHGDFSGFLRRQYLQVSLRMARHVQSRTFEARFLASLATYEKLPRQQESMLRQALSIAESTGDNALIAEVREALERIFPPPTSSRGSKEEQLYESARGLERKRQYKEARALYRQIIEAQDADMEVRIAAYERYAFSYKLEMNRPQYRVELNSMRLWLAKEVRRLRGESDPQLQRWVDEWHKKWIAYARALWTADQLDAGRRQLLALIKESPTNPHLVLDIYWVLANMSLAEKDYPQALVHFERAGQVKGASMTASERVWWAFGWTHYLLKDYPRAVGVWRKASGEISRLSFQRKVQFWQAKAHFLNGEEARARSLWEKLAEDDAFGYYGIIAHLEMQRTLPPLHAPKLSPGVQLPTLDWLIYLGERDVAIDYLQDIQERYRDTDEIVDLLPYYALAGWHAGGIFKFARLESAQRGRVSKMLSTVVFPTPYLQEIQTAAQKYALPAELIYAIARQESAFNPMARSPSDAFGLMQLLPSTAKKMGREARVPYRDFEDLYDPATNVTLGSYYLRKLSNVFQGNFIAMVASYNAGSGNIRKWMKARFRPDPLEFIEMIPYRETRNYVKYVYRNYVIYQRLLGKSVALKKEFFSAPAW